MTVRTQLPTATGAIDVGEGLPTHLIAEIGLNHNGSEELAREMIHAAALSGATFVKFQKRSPVDLATAAFLDAPFEKCPALGRTQREVRERLELSLDAYRRLREYAEHLGLVFFASAFDIPSLEFLRDTGVQIIKVASHSITNGPLLRRIADLKMATIASLGGTTTAEQEQAVGLLRGNPLVLLHCVSAYPTPDVMCTIDTIAALRERFGVPVGFSSHERGIDISVAAATLGACIVERHFTTNNAMVGLDQAISLMPREFGEMAQRIRRIRGARGVAAGLHESEKVAKYAYQVAICAARPIKAGETITESMLGFKQPLTDPNRYFTGMELEAVLNRTTQVALPADTAIPRDALAG